MFELCDGSQNVEEQPAYRRGGVDALLEDLESDLAFLQVDGELGEVFGRAAQPVQPGDHQDVPGPQVS